MSEKKYLKLSDLDAYLWSFHLSNYVWEEIIKWEWFAKKTVGTQFVTAVDSISANVAVPIIIGMDAITKKIKSNFIDIVKVL